MALVYSTPTSDQKKVEELHEQIEKAHLNIWISYE